MPTLQELKDKLLKIQQEMPGVLLQVATSVSLTGKALAERTIKEKGFNEQYSKGKIPIWFLEGKELNAGGLAYMEKQKKGKGKKKEGSGNWGEFRAAQGLQTNFVDLTYTGKMWAGMFPREAYQSGTQYLAPLAHNNKEGQNEMNWNRDRYGDFVGKVLTGTNRDAMAEVAIEEFIRLAFEANNL